MDNFDISKYINMALKRKWWIIIFFLLSILGGLTYLLVTPRIYEAKTLILIQGQRVPEEYVTPVISSSVDDKLNTIYQQVTSRTNSEKIIEEHGLYSSSKDSRLIDKKVALFISRITIDTSKDKSRRNAVTSAFTISFLDEDPRKVMEVTNALASNYISEYLKMREEDALGTSDFLSDELNTIEKQLKAKEEELKQYREKYMGGLPEQLQTNLSILEGLRQEMEQYNNSLRDAENRRDTIIREIALSRDAVIILPDGSQGQRTGGINDLVSLKRELEDLQSRYTLNHPNVIRIKEMISRVEQKKAKTREEAIGSPDEEAMNMGEVDQAMRWQLEDVKIDITNLKTEIAKTRLRIASYQKKVEDTPKREQELIGIKRDYENLKETYSSFRSKEIDAGIAVSMEKKQKGEQFRIIDSAKIPSSPVKPDVKKIILMTLVLGLGLGCGIAYLLEMMDTSYRTPEEAGEDLQLPVLVSIPALVTEKELKTKKRREILMGIGVTLGFCISAASIVISVKGFDTAIGYVKGVFGG